MRREPFVKKIESRKIFCKSFNVYPTTRVRVIPTDPKEDSSEKIPRQKVIIFVPYLVLYPW